MSASINWDERLNKIGQDWCVVATLNGKTTAYHQISKLIHKYTNFDFKAVQLGSENKSKILARKKV